MKFTNKELDHIYRCILADMVNANRFGEEAKTDVSILKKINDAIDQRIKATSQPENEE